MRKIRLLIAVLVVVAFATFVAVALANRIEWAGNKYHLNSAQTGYTNYAVEAFASEGHGENRAVCSAFRYSPEQSCVGRGGYSLYLLGSYHIVEPYIHNHDAEAGYFHGWYE
jgi:hypothetical protein